MTTPPNDRLRTVADWEAAAENARAARFARLDKDLRDALEETEVLSANEEDALRGALAAVTSLRQTW